MGNDVGRRTLPTPPSPAPPWRAWSIVTMVTMVAAAAAVRVCCDHLEALPFSWTSILRPGEKR